MRPRLPWNADEGAQYVEQHVCDGTVRGFLLSDPWRSQEAKTLKENVLKFRDILGDGVGIPVLHQAMTCQSKRHGVRRVSATRSEVPVHEVRQFEHRNAVGP